MEIDYEVPISGKDTVLEFEELSPKNVDRIEKDVKSQNVSFIEQRHKCNFCNKSYASGAILNRHLKSIHKVIVARTTKKCKAVNKITDPEINMVVEENKMPFSNIMAHGTDVEEPKRPCIADSSYAAVNNLKFKDRYKNMSPNKSLLKSVLQSNFVSKQRESKHCDELNENTEERESNVHEQIINFCHDSEILENDQRLCSLPLKDSSGSQTIKSDKNFVAEPLKYISETETPVNSEKYLPVVESCDSSLPSNFEFTYVKNELKGTCKNSQIQYSNMINSQNSSVQSNEISPISEIISNISKCRFGGASNNNNEKEAFEDNSLKLLIPDSQEKIKSEINDNESIYDSDKILKEKEELYESKGHIGISGEPNISSVEMCESGIQNSVDMEKEIQGHSGESLHDLDKKCIRCRLCCEILNSMEILSKHLKEVHDIPVLKKHVSKPYCTNELTSEKPEKLSPPKLKLGTSESESESEIDNPLSWSETINSSKFNLSKDAESSKLESSKGALCNASEMDSYKDALYNSSELDVSKDVFYDSLKLNASKDVSGSSNISTSKEVSYESLELEAPKKNPYVSSQLYASKKDVCDPPELHVPKETLCNSSEMEPSKKVLHDLLELDTLKEECDSTELDVSKGACYSPELDTHVDTVCDSPKLDSPNETLYDSLELDAPKETLSRSSEFDEPEKVLCGSLELDAHENALSESSKLDSSENVLCSPSKLDICEEVACGSLEFGMFNNEMVYNNNASTLLLKQDKQDEENSIHNSPCNTEKSFNHLDHKGIKESRAINMPSIIFLRNSEKYLKPVTPSTCKTRSNSVNDINSVLIKKNNKLNENNVISFHLKKSASLPNLKIALQFITEGIKHKISIPNPPLEKYIDVESCSADHTCFSSATENTEICKSSYDSLSSLSSQNNSPVHWNKVAINSGFILPNHINSSVHKLHRRKTILKSKLSGRKLIIKRYSRYRKQKKNKKAKTRSFRLQKKSKSKNTFNPIIITLKESTEISDFLKKNKQPVVKLKRLEEDDSNCLINQKGDPVSEFICNKYDMKEAVVKLERMHIPCNVNKMVLINQELLVPDLLSQNTSSSSIAIQSNQDESVNSSDSFYISPDNTDVEPKVSVMQSSHNDNVELALIDDSNSSDSIQFLGIGLNAFESNPVVRREENCQTKTREFCTIPSTKECFVVLNRMSV